jgi:hypothetical protein
MPKQFYLTADPAPYTPDAWMGTWDKTADAVTQRLDSTKTTADPAKYTIQSVTSPETSASPLYRVALARFVSGPMEAQVISGTVQIVAGVAAGLAGAELYFSLHIWATVGDSSVIRATLLNNFSELASSGNPFPSTPKGRDLILTAALTAGTILTADRLVVEVGYIARNTSTSSINGTLYYGTDYYSNGAPDMTRDP